MAVAGISLHFGCGLVDINHEAYLKLGHNKYCSRKCENKYVFFIELRPIKDCHSPLNQDYLCPLETL